MEDFINSWVQPHSLFLDVVVRTYTSYLKYKCVYTVFVLTLDKELHLTGLLERNNRFTIYCSLKIKLTLEILIIILTAVS